MVEPAFLPTVVLVGYPGAGCKTVYDIMLAAGFPQSNLSIAAEIPLCSPNDLDQFVATHQRPLVVAIETRVDIRYLRLVGRDGEHAHPSREDFISDYVVERQTWKDRPPDRPNLEYLVRAAQVTISNPLLLGELRFTVNRFLLDIATSADAAAPPKLLARYAHPRQRHGQGPSRPMRTERAGTNQDGQPYL
jgi:hypothetical protein